MQKPSPLQLGIAELVPGETRNLTLQFASVPCASQPLPTWGLRRHVVPRNDGRGCHCGELKPRAQRRGQGVAISQQEGRRCRRPSGHISNRSYIALLALLTPNTTPTIIAIAITTMAIMRPVLSPPPDRAALTTSNCPLCSASKTS